MTSAGSIRIFSLIDIMFYPVKTVPRFSSSEAPKVDRYRPLAARVGAGATP